MTLASMLWRILIWALISAVFVRILKLLSVAVIGGRRNRKRAVGFFHPYTNDGGGGERVLWCAVKAIQEEQPDLDCIVYTGDHDASPDSLVARAVDRFGVKLLYPPKVVHLYKRKWIEETTYPRFTMIGQSMGSVYLSWEALSKFTPLYYFDISGYAFTYPVARMFGCKVVCYTHYPTISLDMLSRVRGRSSTYNNDALIARRTSGLQKSYLPFFNILRSSSANPNQLHSQQLLPLGRPVESPTIISVAQFRPEKAHALQLEAFSVAIGKIDDGMPRPRLQFVGSCRNKADEERLQNLKNLAIDLKVEEDVEFYKNVMYRDLVRLLGSAVAGIHSMIDEHFGICVVEYMAAGAIPIAHNSAGPKMDIVLEEDGQKTGFLAQNVEEYADAILKVLKLPEKERLKMAAAARSRASRFSEERFYEDFKAAVRPILCKSSQ
ncbi:hypothetical protein RHGRI_008049 [Rhododendron griersonianum]|uniref:GDP-Man:Man(3)GlcNAc(2)-PP-Dol alpha-1,2-mannosyltransferase n=1 Tax=Rhododendron griersonianum TaxID=479676 RepID=A0AAV6L251_9ERIC|nr:hypothetical protein RHGRI_008049 [Rhododendron griersonianum]